MIDTMVIRLIQMAIRPENVQRSHIHAFPFFLPGLGHKLAHILAKGYYDYTCNTTYTKALSLDPFSFVIIVPCQSYIRVAVSAL